MNTPRAIFALLLVGLASCVNTAPDWERSFGDASRQTRAQQVIDPDAPSRNTGNPLADGKAVAGAQKAYSKSYGYAVEEPKPTTLLNTSTTGGR